MNYTRLQLLLIEDNADDVALTLRTLKKHHFISSIEVAKDGAEALDRFFGAATPSGPQVPKVILLDLKLPKISGLEVLRKLKSDERTKVIPVVVLTTSQEDRDIEECYQLGVNSYIVKPVDFDDFTRSVSDLGAYWVGRNRVREM